MEDEPKKALELLRKADDFRKLADEVRRNDETAAQHLIEIAEKFEAQAKDIAQRALRAKST